MSSLPQKIHSRKDEIAADFMKLVDIHIAELMSGKVTRRLSAADFAQLLFIAPRHLTNTIKATIGKSPCDIMEERIMLEASTLLRDTDMPVARIGYAFGYADPTNFTKFFKGMCGITPLQYRKTERSTA